MDPIVLLLAGAVAALVMLPVTRKIRVGTTRVVSSGKELLILWSRWLVGALCLGAVVGFGLGRSGYPSLAAGGLTALVVITPASAYFGVRWLYASFRKRARDRKEEASLREESDQRKFAQGRRREREKASKSAAFANHSGAFKGAPALSNGAGSAAGPKAELILANRDDKGAPTQTQDVTQQLADIDDNVRTVTLGESTAAAARPVDKSKAGVPVGSSSDVPPTSREASIDTARQALIVSSDSVGEDTDFEEQHLATLGADQMRAMVVNLREEKHKLQKLVLAQKASLDAEREAHNKTHEYAKATAEELQGSLLKQQRVVKIARRERAQRIKLETRLDTVNRALRNVQSTLRQQADAFEETDV